MNMNLIWRMTILTFIAKWPKRYFKFPNLNRQIVYKNFWSDFFFVISTLYSQSFQNDYGIHFEEQIQSDPMNLAYAPILDIGDENLEYVFHNESIVLPVVFLAKPKPDPQDIQWEIKYGNFLQLANPDEVEYYSLK